MKYQVIQHQHIFRPEAQFKSCHASTIAFLPDGTIGVAWFGGEHEKAADVAIWFSKSDGRGGWTVPVCIADCEGIPCWNPVLFVDNDRVILFYKVGQEIHRWQTMVKESFDSGLTWNQERELVPGDIGGRGPVKNKCIRLSDGAILAPSSTEEGAWNCFTDRSEDGCLTWTRSENVPIELSIPGGNRTELKRGIIQPTLWEDMPEAGEGGEAAKRTPMVHMLMRSSEGCIFRSDSADGGRSWSAAQRTELPNNNCGIDLVQMESGRLVLVYNPVAGDWAARTPIVFAVSDDNGQTWGEPNILDHMPCEHNNEGAEFSYPAIVTKGDDVFISYTWKRRTIAFWQIRMLE